MNINVYEANILASYNDLHLPSDQELIRIGMLADMIECRVTEELNGAYELHMVYVVTGYNADQIQTDRILGASVPLRNSIGENYFRIYRIEKDLTGRMHVYARHLASDLSYMPVRNNTQGTGGRITNFDTWSMMLREYATGSFPFVFDNDGTISGFNYQMPFKTIASVMQYIGGETLIDPDKPMLDLFGGEIVWDKFTILRCNQRGQDRDAAVAYGSNMDNIAIDDDLDGVYTSFILYYQDDEFKVSSDVYSTPYADLFPYQRTEMVDWTFFLSTMEDKTEAKILAALNTAAETYAANHAEAGNPVRRIEASMVAANVQNVYLGDRIGVIYNRHGEHINANMKIVAYEWDVIMQRYVGITLGAIKDTLAKVIAETFTASGAGEDLAQLTQRVSTLESEKVEIERVGSGGSIGYKFSDGTLICTNLVTGTVNIDTDWGSICYNSSLLSLGDWAVPFIAIPTVSYSQQSGADLIGVSGKNTSATSAGSVYVYRPTKGSNNVSISAIAVGRWK